MAEFPFLPIATDSWVADTDHLTRAERGLYMDLIILCWRSPECRVPNEIDWIARKLRCSHDEIQTLQMVISEFMSSSGNWLYQKRLRKEFEYAREKRKKQSDRAKSAWNNGKRSSRGNAGNHASGNAPTPTPTPTLEEKEEAKASSKKNGTRVPEDFWPNETSASRAEALQIDVTTDLVNDFLDYWRAVPGAKGRKLDWQATFRNHLVFLASRSRTSKANTNGQRSHLMDKIGQAIALRRRSEETSGGESGGANLVLLPLR